MDKRELLQSITFGRRVAEEEVEELASYFVETDHWRRILSGEVDIVYGPKGSGKSAIYFLLLSRENQLFDRRILLTPAENPRGAPAFKDLVEDPPTSEQEFRALWKLYLLSLVGAQLQEYGIKNDSAQRVIDALSEAGLLQRGATLSARIRSVLDFVRARLRFESLEGGIRVDPATGLPALTGRITFREPSREEAEKGFISVDELFVQADGGLGASALELWLALDRLDVAFAETRDLEKNALRALFRVYVDLLSLKHVQLKIFLRDDLWQRITEEGFREASHITRFITISWNDQSLMNLVMRRALRNEGILSHYAVNEEQVLASIGHQNELFYRMFPKQVETGPQKPQTFNWMLGRTRDGSRRTAPRELIHLLESIRSAQVKSIETGENPPGGEAIFSPSALKAGLPEVSKARLEQTLFAEYPEVKKYIEALEAKKTEHTITTLATIWGCSEDEAREHARELVDIGFFEKREEKNSYWVPFLYRDALRMVQGAAEEA